MKLDPGRLQKRGKKSPERSLTRLYQLGGKSFVSDSFLVRGKQRSSLHGGTSGGKIRIDLRDSGQGLRRQDQAESLKQQLLILLRLGIAGQNQEPAVGGRQADIDHLNGRPLFDDRSTGQPRGQGAYPLLQS